VWAILQLRPYLEGQRFLVRIDHNSLRWVLNLSDAQGRLARWRLRLLDFNYEVQYSPGKHHHGADTMSRVKPSDPDVAMPSDSIDTEIPCFAMTEERRDPNLLLVEDLCQLQTKDMTRDVTGPNTLGVVSTHSGYSSVFRSMRGVLFGTLNTFYFQQNTSPYISHDTDTMMTHYDTGGTEIP
jgi:hypothetical protein